MTVLPVHTRIVNLKLEKSQYEDLGLIRPHHRRDPLPTIALEHEGFA
eukprot:SAG11_NODE_10829_length_803_cov_1.036932_1_plen_47_part_01